MSDLPKISVDIGRETVQDIVDAAVDLFSPGIESLGWLGDQVRVHRVRSGLKSLRRTQELAAECGIKLIAPPTKFLAQFIEASSLEDADDEELIERWATLLLNAGNTFDSKQVYFVSVLKQLGPIELELLEILARDGGNYRLALIEDATISFEFNRADARDRKKLTEEPALVEDSIAEIVDEMSFPGVVVCDVFVSFADGREPEGDTGTYWQEMHPDYSEAERVHWDILKALNLIREVNYFWARGPLEYRVRAFMFTELGSDFYFACHVPGWCNKMANEVPYKRLHKRSYGDKK